MQSLNYEMLTLARELRGYNQRQLSDLLGIRQGTLSKYEQGGQVINEDLLKKLSSILKLPTTFFYQTDKVYPPDLIYYRRRVAAKRKDLLSAEAKMNIIRMNVQRLLKNVDLPDLNLLRWDVEEHGEPEKAAMHLRQLWNISKGRIDNLTKFAEDNGILIIHLDFNSDKMDGLSLYTMDNQPIVFLNKNLSGDRLRLTLAHEIGHLVMHFGRVPHKDRDVESEAMKFAAELLVPAREFINSITKFDLKNLGSQKRYWLVSIGSLVYRGKELGLITNDQSRYLWQKMGALGYKKREPVDLDVPIEKPTLIKEILSLHEKELSYTQEDIATMLNINVEDLYDYYYANDFKLKIVR